MKAPELKISDLPLFKYFVAWAILVGIGAVAVVAAVVHFVAKFW